MAEKLRQHINVDELQQRLTVTQLANYYGHPLPDRFQGSGEQRMRCPCKDCSGNEDDRSVAINASDPFKRWKCFRGNYGCGAKGNAGDIGLLHEARANASERKTDWPRVLRDRGRPKSD